MDKETADAQIRVFPSDYQRLIKEARKRRTIVAQVLHELLND